jgi:hypothetical protein
VTVAVVLAYLRTRRRGRGDEERDAAH